MYATSGPVKMDPHSADSHFSLFTITRTFSLLSFNAVVEGFLSPQGEG